jgi:hypothetical protein
VLWSGTPDCSVCHRTLSGAPAEQRLLRATVDSTNATVRYSARQKSKAHRTVNRTCPVPLEDKASNGQMLQNPNGWVTWLAHRTVSGGALDYPVRPSTAACPNIYLVVEGYKSPQPPPLQASSTSHSIQELVHSLQDTFLKDQSLSKSRIHSNHLVT